MLTIILQIYPDDDDEYPFEYEENLPDDAPDTLIQSAVRDAVNRFLVKRNVAPTLTKDET